MWDKGLQWSTFKNDSLIFVSGEKPTNNTCLDLSRKYWFVLNVETMPYLVHNI